MAASSSERWRLLIGMVDGADHEPDVAAIALVLKESEKCEAVGY